jgi:hypothetical protein
MRHFSQYLQQLTDVSHRFIYFRQWCCTVRGKDNIEPQIQTAVQWNSSISETVQNMTHAHIHFFA